MPLSEQPDAGPKLAILDDCPKDHVPVQGGGCKRVGVALCADGKGIAGPDDWTCRRVGVEECTAATGGPGLTGPPDWTVCKPIGPSRTCGKGWAKPPGKWWCEPNLPTTKCSDTEMEVIGQTACQPIGECGNGRWGAIKLTPSTVFVDESYQKTGADGSQDKPYPTIGQALAMAQVGAQIAVAAGTYTENLSIDTKVELRGRCAKLVTVKGQSKQPTATITADGAALSGLTITGPGNGIVIEGAKAVIVDRAAVVATGDAAIVVHKKAEARLTDLLVSASVGDGVSVLGAEATIKGCAIRDTKPWVGDGAGVRAAELKVPSEVQVSNSVVLRNWDRGVLVKGSSLSLRGSVVGATLPRLVPMAVLAHGEPVPPIWIRSGVVAFGTGRPASLEVLDSLVAGNHMAGIAGAGANITVERTIVRDTSPQLGLPSSLNPFIKGGWWDGCGWGGGVFSIQQPGGRRCTLQVKDSLFRGNPYSNIAVVGSKGTIQSTVLEATSHHPPSGCADGVLGHGWTKSGAITVEDCLVVGVHGAGVLGSDSNVTVRRTAVRNEASPDLIEGEGVAAFNESVVTVADSTIQNSTSTGIVGKGSVVKVSRSRVEGTRPARKLPTEANNYKWGRPAWGLAVYKAKLDVYETIVGGTQGMGINVGESEAAIERTVVTDNLLAEPDSRSPGIGIRVHSTEKVLSTLTVKDSLVEHARYVGIANYGAEAKVARTVVRDTQLQRDYTGNQLGVGLYVGASVVGPAATPTSKRRRGTLTLEDSVVVRSHRAGLLLWNSKALVRGCSIRDTLAHVGQSGDGISAVASDRLNAGPMAGAGGAMSIAMHLELVDTQILTSAQAGLLMVGGGGSVRGSMFADGMLPIVLEGGANPELGLDNRFVDNLDNKLSFDQALTPVPPPVLPRSPGD